MICAAVPEGATATLTAGNRGGLTTGILLERVVALRVLAIVAMLTPALLRYRLLRTVDENRARLMVLFAAAGCVILLVNVKNLNRKLYRNSGARKRKKTCVKIAGFCYQYE